MGYDRGDSFPFNFEQNWIPFGPENRNENCHHYRIPFNVKGNGNIVSSVHIYSAGTCSNCFIAYLFARLYSNNRFIPRISSDILMFVFILRTIIICWLSKNFAQEP